MGRWRHNVHNDKLNMIVTQMRWKGRSEPLLLLLLGHEDKRVVGEREKRATFLQLHAGTC